MSVIPCRVCGQPAWKDDLCKKDYVLSAWSSNTGVDNLGVFLFFKKVCPAAFKHFKYGTPYFHREIVWEVLRDEPDWTWNDRKIVIAAPRGSSKTTLLSKGLALYLAVFKKKRYIVLSSKTGRSAQKNLRWIRNMLGSSKIIALFGDLRPNIHGKRLDVDEVEGVWSKEIIILRNGVTIEAVGMGQQLRSAAEGEEANRIDLFLADDTETDENTKTPERRETNEVWFFETVLPSLDFDTGTVVFINTLTHTESILAKLLKTERWRKKLYQLDWTDKNGAKQYLWKEKFAPSVIESIKEDYLSIGRLNSFWKEYYNVIKSDRGFNDGWIRYWSGDVFQEGGRSWIRFRVGNTEHTVPAYLTLGIDMSVSRTERADYCALVPIATIHDNRRFVLPYSRGRFSTFDDYDEQGRMIRKGVISEALRLHNKYQFDRIVMDTAGQQLATFYLMQQEVRQLSHPPQVIPYKATTEKFSRLKDLLEPEYQLGRIHHLYGMDDLHRELISFGDTTDDILDALFNAIKFATTPGYLEYRGNLMEPNDVVKYRNSKKGAKVTSKWMVV